MSNPPHPVSVGLCAACAHRRTLTNRRGSMFIICNEAATDPRLRKYPQLPVLRCHAFLALAAEDEADEAADAANEPPRPDPT